MPKLIDITGESFGKLTVLSYFSEQQLWKCICDCGNERLLPSHNLRSGRTQSCGCFRKESPRNRTHGESHRTPEWLAWVSMRRRCFDPNTKSFRNYGGRGITVCARWAESYEAFLADILAAIGRRPSPKHQLDRINNDGNYEPGNVKWSTQKEQMKTRRHVGPFWDLTVRRAAGEKGRKTRWSQLSHCRSPIDRPAPQDP